MIPRLRSSQNGEQGKVDWPPDPTERSVSLFKARIPLRRLIVMIDSELQLDPPPSPYTDAELFADRRGLLSGLLTHPFVSTYRFSFAGPPPGAADAETRWGIKARAGWITIDRSADSTTPSVIYRDRDGAVHLSGIIGNAAEIAANDVSAAIYADRDSGEARSLRELDALTGQIAHEGLGADLYVTDREYLLLHPWIARGVTVCRPEEALPLVSLYLRAQGQFILTRPEPDELSANRGLFFWVGTRELLGEAWRWLGACTQHAHHQGDDALFHLGASLLQRVEPEPVKANETSSQDFFCASLSMVGLLIHASVGSLGGLGFRFRNRQGLAA